MRKGQDHPSALLSKNMISAALIELLQEKDYREITITEICTHSQIARRTFYRNFKRIDDVLTFYITGIFNDFTSEMQKHSKESYYNIVVAYFTFWISYKDLLILIARNGLTHIIFMEYIKCLADVPFMCSMELQTIPETEAFPFIRAFTAGGLWSMLTYYISMDCKQSPQMLAQFLTQ